MREFRLRGLILFVDEAGCATGQVNCECHLQRGHLI